MNTTSKQFNVANNNQLTLGTIDINIINNIYLCAERITYNPFTCVHEITRGEWVEQHIRRLLLIPRCRFTKSSFNFIFVVFLFHELQTSHIQKGHFTVVVSSLFDNYEHEWEKIIGVVEQGFFFLVYRLMFRLNKQTIVWNCNVTKIACSKIIAACASLSRWCMSMPSKLFFTHFVGFLSPPCGREFVE